jgi:hypothetical protein
VKRIYKYELSPNSPQMIELPEGAQILTAQGQHGRSVCLWALVDPERPKEQRYFEVFATGEAIHTDMGLDRNYIGTAQLEGGQLIFHVFERLS